MSYLFGDFKRPRAEKKVIDQFIKKFENAKTLFKSKNYLEALTEYNKAYELLSDIWDVFPKIITLYIIMKGYFYTRQYDSCRNIMDILEPLLEYIPKSKFDLFIKLKSKIMIYQLILEFIYNHLDESFDAVIGMIKYLSQNDIFTLEEKTKFFWKYIKGFLKITGITKGNKFMILKEGFDSMIVEQILISDDNQSNKNENTKPSKKINRNMIEIYKNFMNSKLRSIVYEVLDKEFFYVKYNKNSDKVMQFLHKNMDIFIRDNNKDKLMEIFHTFIVLNKINFKKEYNMELSQLVFEQKRRIETFDKIYNNLVGSFNHIFKQDFSMPIVDVTKNIKKNISKKNSFKFNIKELKNMIKVKINSPLRWRKRKSQISKEEEENIKNDNQKSNNNNIISRKTSFDFAFINDIKIPPNTEEMDKQILYDNYITRKNLLNNIFNKRTSTRNNYKMKSLKTISNTRTIMPKINRNLFNIKLPSITIPNNDIDNEEEKHFMKNMCKRKIKLKLDKKKQKKVNESENESIQKKNINLFKLRNINNYFITKILSIFSTLYNNEHNIQPDESQEIEHIVIKRKDLFDFNHKNYIKSYNAISIKGSQTENQDNYFFYDNYFLIKNLYFFGVSDGHGKYGKEIAKNINILFPSYLFYLLVDDNLSERQLDINKQIIKLVKLQEPPLNIKHMFILTYFFNKFEIDFTTIPFISNTQQKKLNHLLLESIYYSQNELKSRYDLDISSSGSTLCSAFILGKILYLVNIGDSRAVMGTYNSRMNTWKTTQLTIDHKPNNPNENRRILFYNGRIDRMKNDFGDEVGPYRIYGKDNDNNGIGLAMSRSIGDMNFKKYGVIYEPEMFKYELEENDKIIIIGTDGLYEQLTNEDVINIAGDCMNKDLNARETSEIIIEKAREKYKKEIETKKKKYKKHNYDDNYYLHGHKDEIQENLNHHGYSHSHNYNPSHIDDITCIVIFLDVK